jgi:hypothetical protein
MCQSVIFVTTASKKYNMRRDKIVSDFPEMLVIGQNC